MRYALAVALIAIATPARADLAEVSRHLAAVTTMTAAFTQTADDGAVLTGRVTLKRPGRVRFQYDRAPFLVVADGRALHLIDYRVAQVSSWPVRGTPLAVLLDPTLDLGRFARVVDDSRGAGVTIEAADPRHPEYGTTTLRFARDASGPGGLRLEGWKVRDSQGKTTRVALSATRFDRPVADETFTFRDPRPKKVPGRG